MIYFCADDYGLNKVSSMRIQKCIDEGVLNKVSVFPNIDVVDLSKVKNAKISLHLNLVEGKCLANAEEVSLLTDKDGNFKNTFGGLFKLNLFNKKEFEQQVYKEIRAQVLFFKNILPKDLPLCIDSHQHTHMIPCVFNSLIKVLKDENISIDYMRIPAEPLMPYIKTPSLYFTYNPINIIKQWLLKFLWLINKNAVKDFNFSSAQFFGILFSGKMDKKRVNKILSKYPKNKDTEVLFHPGYLDASESEFENKNIVFKNFYLSKNRRTEFDSAMTLSERSGI